MARSRAVGRNLDQVAIGIATVDRPNGAQSAGPGNGPVLDCDAAGANVGERLRKRVCGDQAKVGGAGHRIRRLGFDLLPKLVKIDLLVAELKRLPTSAERDHSHAKNPLVERACRIHVGDRQDEVINSVDPHVGLRSAAQC